MRALQQLVASRRRLVGDKGRITNRLTSALKNYYPQTLAWFKDKDTVIFCDFLERWPTLKAVQHARKATLKTFFRAHHVRYAQIIEQRIKAIKTATALTTDSGVIEPNVLLVQALISHLRAILDAICRFDSDLEARCLALTDYPFFESLPGAGPVFASRLLAAFGEQRERYTGADALQQYAGIAPVTERSGQKSWIHWQRDGRPFSDKPSSNVPVKQCRVPSGPGPITASNATKAARIRAPFAPWHSSGSESSTAVGTTEHRITSRLTSMP